MPATYRKTDGSGGYLKSLHDRAKAKPVDNWSSIATYYRSADLLLRQADQYRRLHNDDELYVMLMRFASLIIETLPKHRAFTKTDPKYQQLHNALVERHLPELERLAASIKLRRALEEFERQGPFQPKKTAGTVLLSAGNLPEIHWDWGELQSAGQAGVAVSSARTMQAPPPAGAQLGVPQPAGFDLLSGMGSGPPTAAQPAVFNVGLGGVLTPALLPCAPPLPALPELSTSIRLPAASLETLSKHALLPMGSFGSSSTQQQSQRPQRQQLLPARPLYPELAALEPPPPPPAAQHEVPTQLDAALASLDIGRQQQADGLQPPLLAEQQQQVPSFPQPSPYGELQLGPQEVGVTAAPRPTLPLPPGATCCEPGGGPGAGPPPPPPEQGQLVPAPPQAQPPSGGVAEVKRLQTIRDVHVSVALMDEFMRYAVSNTRRGIESCGILAGTLSADDAVFTITTLIVPKQHGTSDTVEMLNEEEIFEVQDSRALYPLGWIHTHPTQTCFLSSVDIHTHCGFQTMLDEAVAIVMAPRDPTKRVGIFRLSTPGGLKLVQRCPQRGFHPHPPTETGQPVYELCGHVYLNPRAKYEVIDLR